MLQNYLLRFKMELKDPVLNGFTLSSSLRTPNKTYSS